MAIKEISMDIHFVAVGCGNLTLVCFPNGTTYLCDCNVTEDNEEDVLTYLYKAMGARTAINVFVCSHRDADHIRGLGKIHARFPIGEIQDPGVPGTTTDSPEYQEYMALRREIGASVARARTYLDVGEARLRFMNAKDDDFSDANDQSIVMKIEFGGSSAILAGDTTFLPWKDKILPFYPDERLKTDILLAAHHGSLSFFDDPSNERYYYVDHMKKIGPAMTIVSVGPNVHGLPDPKAMELYEKHSSGSNKGNKVYRTDEQGNVKLTLKQGGGWTIQVNQ